MSALSMLGDTIFVGTRRGTLVAYMPLEDEPLFDVVCTLWACFFWSGFWGTCECQTRHLMTDALTFHTPQWMEESMWSVSGQRDHEFMQ